jgi:hypothetical protein
MTSESQQNVGADVLPAGIVTVFQVAPPFVEYEAYQLAVMNTRMPSLLAAGSATVLTPAVVFALLRPIVSAVGEPWNALCTRPSRVWTPPGRGRAATAFGAAFRPRAALRSRSRASALSRAAALAGLRRCACTALCGSGAILPAVVE